jgi:bacteriorhodopsin
MQFACCRFSIVACLGLVAVIIAYCKSDVHQLESQFLVLCVVLYIFLWLETP